MIVCANCNDLLFEHAQRHETEDGYACETKRKKFPWYSSQKLTCSNCDITLRPVEYHDPAFRGTCNWHTIYCDHD